MTPAVSRRLPSMRWPLTTSSAHTAHLSPGSGSVGPAGSSCLRPVSRRARQYRHQVVPFAHRPACVASGSAYGD
jgi:hypothetical protein